MLIYRLDISPVERPGRLLLHRAHGCPTDEEVSYRTSLVGYQGSHSAPRWAISHARPADGQPCKGNLTGQADHGLRPSRLRQNDAVDRMGPGKQSEGRLDIFGRGRQRLGEIPTL